MTKLTSYAAVGLVGLLVLGGCGGSGSTKNGTSDSGGGDSSVVDTGTPADTGSAQDGTVPDSGGDATVEDSGASPDSFIAEDSSPPEDTSSGDTTQGDTEAPVYTVGGTVTGLTGTLVLQDNGSDSLSLTAGGAFTFATGLANGGAYDVSVLTQPTGETCTVTNGTGTIASSSVTTVVVTCVASVGDGGGEAGDGGSGDGSTDGGDAATYTIGGTVTGLSGTLVLEDNGSDTVSVSASGAFTFIKPVASGGAYAVTVQTQPAGQTCVVTNGTGTVGSTNVTNVTVACAANPYTIGGTVTGLAATDAVVLQDNGGNNLTVSANGSFTFTSALAANQAYAVTVLTQPSNPAQTCTVTGGSGTTTNASVTSVQVACVTKSFTVGGTLTGLAAGASLVLQDNGGDNLSVSANGAFTFATPVVSGGMYAVTIHTQPASQVCTVSAGTGTINGANASSVVVNCSSSYTVGGSVNGLAGGNTIALKNNGGSLTFVTTNGAFAFPTPVPTGTAYAVTVSGNPSTPTGQICTVTNGSGTVGTANVTTITITCTTNTSCKQILATQPTAPSGAYNIFAGGQEFGVYCDMTDAGGGWTLALKINGLVDGGTQTFTYNQPIWTNTTLLNPTSTDLSENEAKFLSYTSIPFTNILGMMTGATATNVLVIPVSDGTSLLHLISTSAQNTVNTTLGRTAWVDLTNPTATPQFNCNMEGINQGVGGTDVRIGLVTNQENDCLTPDSATGFGISGNSAVGSPGPSAGSAAGGPYEEPGASDVLNFGYVFVR